MMCAECYGSKDTYGCRDWANTVCKETKTIVGFAHRNQAGNETVNRAHPAR